MDTTEHGFEDIIAERLVAHGYRLRVPPDYNREHCLDPELVLAFVEASQAAAWAKLTKVHGEAHVRDKFLRRLSAEIVSRGTLDVLRTGVKDSGAAFRLAFFAPETGRNPEHAARHARNVLSVVRQLRYSRVSDNELDLTLFLNGLPIATAELKNHLTGQTVGHAVKQYRNDRDPREPLLAERRCLVHFAVDENDVFMTTKLAGPETVFLPFNKGRDGGAGNPDNPTGYRSAYLWEEIWRPDALLEIVNHFVVEKSDSSKTGRGAPKRSLIFPRYHQLDAVRRLVAHARAHGAGQSYLVQHSAGSGKSNTIAWLCHRLAGLHDAADERVFDSIVVVTDRRVLDAQLRETVGQFEQTKGLVVKVEQHSRELREALEEGKQVIVTTLQKFPFIVDGLGALPGRRFAVVIDEAHSSQSGTGTETMKQVLATARDAGEAAPSPDDGQDSGTASGSLDDDDDAEDAINRLLASRGRLAHVSYFAFTATPKPKTLELFGTHLPDGQFAPFSLYSMRQAIEERFILDVLANYTTYHTYFGLAKRIPTDPEVDRKPTIRLLRQYANLHEHAVHQKTALMVEHFWEFVRPQIDGRAKAMVVTRSRRHAVRYKLAVDRYLREHNYPIKTLVAFSGEVEDGGMPYTEPGMNAASGKPIPESATAETFAGDEYRIMIVAEKFQTGFDQPLLQTMYVDKRLSGVNAVQTLSRLNRIHPGKTETMVLDFENDAEELLRSFQPYYETTLLSEGTDPNKLYDLQRLLLGFRVFDEDDVERFWRVFASAASRQDKLHPILDAAVDRFGYLPKEQRTDFADRLTDYVRLYAFLAQIIPFADPELEKLYRFSRLLGPKLPKDEAKPPAEIAESINMESYRVQKMSDGRIVLSPNGGVLDPIAALGTGEPTQLELEPLSVVIRDVNERYGTEFSDDDRVALSALWTRLTIDPDLVDRASVASNSRENLRLVFEDRFLAVMQGLIDSNFDLYRRVSDDAEFGDALKGHLFELVYGQLRPPGQTAVTPPG